MLTLDLREPHLKLVLEVVGQAPGIWVWAYGSRVRGTNHAASDLDLVVRGPGGAAVPLAVMRKLREGFEESQLPISVDVLDWGKIPAHFQQEIDGCSVLLVEGEAAPHPGPDCPTSPAGLDVC